MFYLIINASMQLNAHINAFFCIYKVLTYSQEIKEGGNNAINQFCTFISMNTDF